VKAFITGSHAYGTPREDSDIDLVVFVSPNDLKKLAGVEGGDSARYGNLAQAFLRFGNLNLLAVDNDTDYEVWLKGTVDLKARRPVTRDEAVAHFKMLQTEARPEQIDVDFLADDDLEFEDSLLAGMEGDF
jgi:hypothetical protein